MLGIGSASKVYSWRGGGEFSLLGITVAYQLETGKSGGLKYLPEWGVGKHFENLRLPVGW